jgi:hypothetical protein
MLSRSEADIIETSQQEHRMEQMVRSRQHPIPLVRFSVPRISENGAMWIGQRLESLVQGPST